VIMIAGGGGGSAFGTPAYRMSYRVAPIVSTEVTATARSAQDPHHGQESLLVSSGCAMSLEARRSGVVPSRGVSARFLSDKATLGRATKAGWGHERLAEWHDWRLRWIARCCDSGPIPIFEQKANVCNGWKADTSALQQPMRCGVHRLIVVGLVFVGSFASTASTAGPTGWSGPLRLIPTLQKG
jgi:hypothetical protein